MDGLKPGRIVYYTDHNGEVHPSMVTAVHDERGLINLTSIVDRSGSVWPHMSVPHNQAGGINTWRWMYDGQATRGEAVVAGPVAPAVIAIVEEPPAPAPSKTKKKK